MFAPLFASMFTPGCWSFGFACFTWMTMVRWGGGMFLGVWCAGWGISAFKPVGRCSATTTMKTIINTSRTSISGVTFICGEDGLPPENAILFLPFVWSQARACLEVLDTRKGGRVPVLLTAFQKGSMKGVTTGYTEEHRGT